MRVSIREVLSSSSPAMVSNQSMAAIFFLNSCLRSRPYIVCDHLVDQLKTKGEGSAAFTVRIWKRKQEVQKPTMFC